MDRFASLAHKVLRLWFITFLARVLWYTGPAYPPTTQRVQLMTVEFLVMGVLYTVAYDAWAYQMVGSEGTISRVILLASRKHPLFFGWLLIGIGVLFGHLFLPQILRDIP
jgi:hypothetical protein